MDSRLTKEDLYILSLYTGFLFVENFSELHQFAEKLICRPILTHEFVTKPFLDEVNSIIKPNVEIIMRKMFLQAAEVNKDILE